jgi:hypothetical protein
VAAGLLSTGNVTGTFVLAGLAVLSLLFLVENAFGIFVVLAILAVIVGVARYASPTLQVVVACLVTWHLLFGAIRSVGVLRVNRRYTSSSDADTLAWLTHIPAVVWIGIFYATDLYCLLFGGRLLLAG